MMLAPQSSYEVPEGIPVRIALHSGLSLSSHGELILKTLPSPHPRVTGDTLYLLVNYDRERINEIAAAHGLPEQELCWRITETGVDASADDKPYFEETYLRSQLVTLPVDRIGRTRLTISVVGRRPGESADREFAQVDYILTIGLSPRLPRKTQLRLKLRRASASIAEHTREAAGYTWLLYKVITTRN